MALTFIAVEGQHEVEFLSGLCKSFGYKKVTKVAELDEDHQRHLLQTKYPYEGDLLKRMPNPMFLSNGSDWIALQAAGDASQLCPLVRRTLVSLKSNPSLLTAIGVVRDADSMPGNAQFNTLRNELSQSIQVDGFSINLPETPGAVNQDSPRVGIFILPDNSKQGTLEELLFDCGRSVYPHLIERAGSYVNTLDLAQLNSSDVRLINKPHGKDKAVIASAASILKPGMAIGNSIDQNRWINEVSIALPRIAKLTIFLQQLCGLS